jgi:hypothetical protein
VRRRGDVALAAAIALAGVGAWLVLSSDGPDPPRLRAANPNEQYAAERAGAGWGAQPEAKLASAAVRGCAWGSGVGGDFDGDGREDTALVGRPGCGTRHSLVVVLGDGPRLRRWLDDSDLEGTWHEHGVCDPDCAVAAADLDGDGRDELLVTLWRGASQSGFGVFRAGRRGIRRIHLDDGGNVVFQTGGSLCCVSYVVCRARPQATALVVQIGAGHSDWAAYWSEDLYAFDGWSFRRLGKREGAEPWSEGWPPIRPGRGCG